MIARVTISGDAVRIRLDNTFGTAPLSIGKAYVGQRIQGAALAARFKSAGVLQQVRKRDGSCRRQCDERSGTDDCPGAAGPGGESAHSRRRRAAKPTRRRASDVLCDGEWLWRCGGRGNRDTVYRHDHVDVLVESDRRVSLVVLHRIDCRVRRFDYRRHVLDRRCPRPLGRPARRASGSRGGRPRQRRRRAQGHRQRGHRRQHRHAREASTAARQSSGPRAARTRRADPSRGDARHSVHGNQRYSSRSVRPDRSSPACRTSSGA